MAQTKAELEDRIKFLEKTLDTRIGIIVDKDREINELNKHIKELEAEKRSRRDDAEYISWLQLNYKHIKRFIQENVDVCTEVDYDYYGTPGSPYSTIEIREPNELKE